MMNWKITLFVEKSEESEEMEVIGMEKLIYNRMFMKRKIFSSNCHLAI